MPGSKWTLFYVTKAWTQLDTRVKFVVDQISLKHTALKALLKVLKGFWFKHKIRQNFQELSSLLKITNNSWLRYRTIEAQCEVHQRLW